MYCKKYFEETNDNKLNSIFIYDNDMLIESFNNEKEMFIYFFDFYFRSRYCF